MTKDTISNMLSALKNAAMVEKELVELPYSKTTEAVAKVLAEYKFIKGVKVFKEKGAPHKSLRIDLAYDENGIPPFRDIRRVSKSGRRIYKGSEGIKRVHPTIGLVVVSTTKGVMSGEKARKSRLGGEIICELV